MATKLNTYFVEVTDTFNGEANYSWFRRFKVRASTRRGAVIKVSRECGYQNHIVKRAEFGDMSEHDVRGACARIKICIGLADAKGCSRPGSCDLDVAALRAEPYIVAQLAEITDDSLGCELDGYGAWDDAELADREANLTRLLWLACCDIAENPDQGLE